MWSAKSKAPGGTDVRKRSIALFLGMSSLAGCSPQFRAAQDAVISQMKDGGATEFRNIRYCGSEGNSVIIGEYNSKNSFGAYSGFETFYYDDGIVELPDHWGSLFDRCSVQRRAESEAFRRTLSPEKRREADRELNIALYGEDVAK
jgi:hypothetical protein